MSTVRFHRLTPAPKLILLPGLDGTGGMFGPLLAVLPAGVDARVIAYPPDQVLTQGQLAGRVADELAGAGAVVLVAESYSGVVALHVAEALAQHVPQAAPPGLSYSASPCFLRRPRTEKRRTLRVLPFHTGGRRRRAKRAPKLRAAAAPRAHFGLGRPSRQV